MLEPPGIVQTNAESVAIQTLESTRCDAVLINPGGYAGYAILFQATPSACIIQRRHQSRSRQAQRCDDIRNHHPPDTIVEAANGITQPEKRCETHL